MLAGLLDAQALMHYRKAYLEITHNLEEAKKDQDHARSAELEKQMETFSAQIDGAIELGGRKRDPPN